MTVPRLIEGIRSSPQRGRNKPARGNASGIRPTEPGATPSEDPFLAPKGPQQTSPGQRPGKQKTSMNWKPCKGGTGTVEGPAQCHSLS